MSYKRKWMDGYQPSNKNDKLTPPIKAEDGKNNKQGKGNENPKERK